MKHLPLTELDELLKPYERLLLMLDFDGTLVPLVNSSMTVLSHETHDLLEHFAQLPNSKVAVISGRSMEELTRLCPLRGVSLGSDHGVRVEIDNQRCEWFGNIWAVRRVVTAVYEKLRRDLHRPTHNHFLEHKPFSVAFYYTGADPAETLKAVELFRSAAPEFDADQSFHFIEGKSIVEYRPHQLHKGMSADFFARRQPPSTLPIFIGDDRTDEDAFEALRKLGGIGIHVGPKPSSAAAYFLEDQPHVHSYLARLYAIMHSKAAQL